MTAASPHEDRAAAGRRRAAMALLAVTLLAVAAVRVRLAPLPLERDEGEYAYAGQLALQGVPPFVELYNMKMPGIYWAYAAVMAVFGQTPAGIRVGLLALNAATVLLAYRLGRRVFDPLASAVAACTYAWLALGAGVMGPVAHAEHFVVFFVLLGLLCLPSPGGASAWRALLAGLFLGAAFTMKQHAAPFMVYGGVCMVAILLRERAVPVGKKCVHAGLFALGAIAPFIAICAIMWNAGVFATFWFWTFTYARSYISQVPVRDAAQAFVDGTLRAAEHTWLCWLVAVLGVAGLWRYRQRALLVGGLAAAGLVAISPGFYFREHYFILLLPAVAAFATMGAQVLAGLPGCRTRQAVVLLLVAALFWGQLWQRQWWFFTSGDLFGVSRSMYRAQPFPESLEVARYIREHSGPNDRVAVLGSEPQILFYAQRRSATPFVYMYPLMEVHPAAKDMQREMIAGIERAMPKFVVVVSVKVSWLVRKASATDLFDWYPGFLDAHYRHVGMFDLGPTVSEFYWDAEMSGHAHSSEDTIDVFVRNDAAHPPVAPESGP
ncbi:MAG: hypothetical protein FJY92_03260 [Candidatus Hydrogenedentes bacterium]|nr:hypothetical protein [Candidatus Hydrogenedentota bacterium]